MWTELPYELLDQIFSHRNIGKKDLMQLQLTCKSWSALAQRYLYKNIDISDSDLYHIDLKRHDYPAMKKRLASLMKSLLLANNQAGKCIEAINFDILFHDDDYTCTGSPEDLPSYIAALAPLCPNLTSIDGYLDSTEYLDTLSHLHRRGYFQRLKSIVPPSIQDERDLASYHAAILEFKDTLRGDLVVVDGVSNSISTDSLIPPTSLQLFKNVDHIQLNEYQRVHLYRFKDYISNCGPKVKSLEIKMHDWLSTTFQGFTRRPLQLEYSYLHSVQPQENIQAFNIPLDCRITLNELDFLMRILPSLKSVSLCFGVLGAIVINQRDERVVAQFFGYLSRMSEVDCMFVCSVVPAALDLLPHLANSINIKELSISSSRDNVIGRTELMATLKNQSQAAEVTTTASKTNGFHVAVSIYSTDPKQSFITAIESLSSKFIESISIGGYYDRSDAPHKIDQHSLECIAANYTGVQNLMFEGIEFPLQAPQTAIQRVQQLNRLHLCECKVSKSYFSSISQQFEKINHFKFTSKEWENNNNAANKTSVHLPYTAIKTMSLSIMCAESYIIRVWANAKCVTLRAAQHDIWAMTLKECDDTESLPDGYNEVTARCKTLEEICCYKATFKLL